MFTVKYRSFGLSPKQSGDGPFYDMSEQLHGPFLFVSQEHDEDGYMVVHAHRDDSAPGFVFGPFRPAEIAGKPHPRPTLWVMNEAGATVAKYDL